jgi:hypothetical protein
MSERECPECGESLGANDPVCPKCGHGPETATAQAPPAAGSQTALLIGLAIGLAVGLIAGWIWGRASAPAPPRPKPSMASGTAKTLRLREREWRQGAGGLCTGVFEVVSAPPSITGLSFSVMDSKGKVIGSDKVSSPRGIKPHTVLELGFETGDCSKINKWTVQVITDNKKEK